MGLKPMILAAAWVALVILVWAIIVAASLLRCRRCRKWHDSEEDENNCKGE